MWVSKQSVKAEEKVTDLQPTGSLASFEYFSPGSEK